MQWPDVHLECKEWQIAMTKNGEPHTVLLTPEAIKVLKRRKKDTKSSKSLFVFPGSGETGHLVEPRGAWERMLARSTALGLVEALAEKHGLHLQHYEMRDLHIHDLRRTLGSWLASRGTSLTIIGRVLNHKTA
jgi:integrase